MKKGSHTERKPVSVGGIVNIILFVLYIPLSVMGCMLGTIVSEGYMLDTTVGMKTLSRVITVLGAVTPVVAVGSIIASVLLRRKGHGILSFLIQFFPLIHMGNLLILDFILEIARGWI